MAFVNENTCLQHLGVLQELLAETPNIMEMHAEQDIKDQFLAVIDSLSQDALPIQSNSENDDDFEKLDSDGEEIEY